ncbi:hypothetical protein PSTG_04137 [Puccinia striiformis f. sp. tritici PST-78]|uniref:UBR-type domain-containing protein n=1 Tax=Puccinia striiformis f. sp. tritici PST-78 TaxID=1165861 RepID=A0A0L0VTL3_9BASI|nr:hypothetical protein PSTG_04137 [Puccinia striiformis f. sp. tritici PST-78]
MAPSPPNQATTNPDNETVRISEVISKQNELEEQVAEVLPFDISRCSKLAGRIRQSIYSCLTCNPPNSEQTHLRAGICSSCSVSCHSDHQLVELFVRRDFVCDCGTQRCNPAGGCQLTSSINYPPVDQSVPSTSTIDSSSNRYDKNFDGQFCICERGKTYDPETETEDMYQCLSCEDWRHASCLGAHPDPDDWDDLICADCVQTNPILKSILFKHVGGERTGMMVCKGSGSDGPDRVTCYGRLSSSSSASNPNSPPNQPDGHAEKSGGEAGSSVAETANVSGHQIEKPTNSISRTQPDSRETSTEASGIGHGDLGSTPVLKEGIIIRGSKKRSASIDNVEDNSTKKVKVSSNLSDCQAPFQDESSSILTTIDPSFSNVFLASGWRSRWCRCDGCRQSLSTYKWMIEEEEEVWEPGEDNDSLKSLHELGLEALKTLPRDQLVTGLDAYNKLKTKILEFLKPFESNDRLVTEHDIREFFKDTKSKISNRTW